MKLDSPDKRMAYALLETMLFREMYPKAEFRVWTAFNIAISTPIPGRKYFSGRVCVRTLVALPPVPESEYVAHRKDRG